MKKLVLHGSVPSLPECFSFACFKMLPRRPCIHTKVSRRKIDTSCFTNLLIIQLKNIDMRSVQSCFTADGFSLSSRHREKSTKEEEFQAMGDIRILFMYTSVQNSIRKREGIKTLRWVGFSKYLRFCVGNSNLPLHFSSGY